MEGQLHKHDLSGYRICIHSRTELKGNLTKAIKSVELRRGEGGTATSRSRSHRKEMMVVR